MRDIHNDNAYDQNNWFFLSALLTFISVLLGKMEALACPPSMLLP
jgi:hypothetical protein